MRRWICLILVLCFCTSCSRSVTAPVTSGFRCCIQAEYHGIAMTALLDRTDPSKTSIQFRSPDELKGVELIFFDDSVQMSFSGVTFEIPSEYKKDSLFLSIMLKKLDKVCDGTVQFDPDFVFDSITGLPLSFTSSEENMTVYFSEWETISTNTKDQKISN